MVWFEMNKASSLYARYKHFIPMLVFLAIYLSWFSWLEKDVTKYQLIHVALDDYIPFCEVFIVPYLLWFVYVAAVVVLIMLKDKQEYYKSCAFLMTGMTIFLIISTLWPNGHDLRPAVLPRDNVFSDLVAMLWRADTPTNLWPSIHVYNSMGAHFAVAHSSVFTHRKGLKMASLVLAVSIILSTMLLKQHSVFDVVTGLFMGGIMYVLVYRRDWLFAPRVKRLTQHN